MSLEADVLEIKGLLGDLLKLQTDVMGRLERIEKVAGEAHAGVGLVYAKQEGLEELTLAVKGALTNQVNGLWAIAQDLQELRTKATGDVSKLGEHVGELRGIIEDVRQRTNKLERSVNELQEEELTPGKPFRVTQG